MDKKQAVVLRKAFQYIYGKINLTKPSFQDKQKANSTYLVSIQKKKKVQRMKFIFLNLLNQNLFPYGLGVAGAENIIPESQIRAEH